MARNVKANWQRYYAAHRDEIRAKNRAYAAKRRREAGMPALGTPESTENRRRARKATGAEHGNWKGDDVGYFALHVWLHRNVRRTGTCTDCGATPKPPSGRRVGTEWANLSGEYRRDPADYVEFCIPCHRRRDSGGIKHGTSTGYDYHRCRCDECRRAATARRRAYVIRKREEARN